MSKTISYDDAEVLLDLGDRLIEIRSIQHDDVRIWLGKLGHYHQADHLMDLARDLEYLYWDSDKDEIVFGPGVFAVLTEDGLTYQQCIDKLGWQHDAASE